MTLEEKLRSKHQGIPGLGVDTSVGVDGRKGKSIYVGHVKDFFDGNLITKDEYGYIRIKNQEDGELPEFSKFYYKDQENFYRALSDEIKRMTTFSIRNLQGMYLKPGKNPRSNLEQGSYDFSRFGWSLDLHYLIQNYGSESPDVNIRKFKNWLLGKSQPELEQLDKKLFTLDQDGNIVTRTIKDRTDGVEKEVPEPYFKYMSLNRSIIDDPSYPNPYSLSDFRSSIFGVKIADGEDDPMVDYKGVDYLKERRENQSMTNYNTRYTDDIFMPTNLEAKYKEGDILYIQDDVTDLVISYIVVTADMVRCSYKDFIKKSTIPIKSLIYPFKVDDERVQLFKNLIVSDFEIFPAQEKYKNNAINNFIKKNDNNFSLTLSTNKEFSNSLLGLQPFVESPIQITDPSNPDYGKKVKYDPIGHISFGIDSDNKFKISSSLSSDSTTKIRFSNLWIKDCWSNINVQEYYDNNIKLIEGLYIDNVDEEDFGDDYTTVKINPNKFFNYVSEDNTYIYGLVVIDPSTNTMIDKFEFYDASTHEVEYAVKMLSKSYKLLTYAAQPNTSVYWSLPSTISINGDDYTISKYSKEEVKKPSIFIFDNKYFTFESSNITCEQGEVEIDVNSGEGDYTIDNIWINGTNIENASSSNSWISCSDCQYDSSKKKAILKFNIDSNLPEGLNESITDDSDTDIEQTNIAKYLKFRSERKKIGDNIQETPERVAILTVLGHNDKQKVRTSCRIVQPGFSSPIYDVSVDFFNLVNNNAIEKSNDSDNGILCNQVQFFTEIKVNGFDSSTWGQYLENPKIYVYVNLNNNIEATNDSNYNNVHFYSINDKKKFANNAVRVKFSWIPNTNNSEVSFDSSMWLIEGEEKEFKSYSYVIGDNIDATPNLEEWKYFSDASFLYSDVSTNEYTCYQTPKDIVYRINDTSSGGEIGGLTFEDVSSGNRVKIRTIAEVANPVPMEFNFRWKVEKIEIRGKIKRDLTNLTPGEEDTREELVFIKDFINEYDEKTNPLSDNVKFIINPVYMTACPKEAENFKGYKIGEAIMNVGPEDNPKVKIGIQDIDKEAKKEFDMYFVNDPMRISVASNKRIYVSNIKYYWPKKRYFQDNIQNLYIKPRDFKGDVASKAITKKNSPFVELLDFLKPQESNLFNTYNIALIDPSTSINEDFTKSFLMMTFNGYVMNPEYRNEKLTFYYNNRLYKEKMFDQWNSVSPLWIKEELEIEMIDSSLLEAKHTWNYEYEVSKAYVNGKTRGGLITKSGYGYLELGLTEDQKYDTGQYDSLGILNLEDTISESDKLALTDPTILNVPAPNEYVNAPSFKEFFRSLLFDAKWIYPYYVNINNTVKVYPYYFSNSYESWIDMKIMEGYINDRDQDTIAKFEAYIDASSANGLFKPLSGLDVSYGSQESFGWPAETSKNNYKKLKLDKNLYMVKNDYIEFEKDTDKTKINMLIPYNVLYTIYPRTMYNTDQANTINVFMLQQPTIVTDDNFSLNKHYFEIPPFNDEESEKEREYYSSAFEEGKEVIAPVLPPWNFNK